MIELPLAAHQRLDELRHVGGVDAHVRVQDQEDLAPSLAESQPHGVALALPGLLEEPQGKAGILLDDRADHRLRVVRRVAFHEEELAVGTEARQPGHQRPDVAGLVAAGDHDAHARVGGRARAEAVRRPGAR